jgi:large subunit ribosomal protein L25
MLTLQVEERGGGATDDIRRRGFVPAVLYGRKEVATAIAVDARQLERVWKEAGHTSVVKLKGAGEEKETLIKDVQIHPVSGRLVHADFYALEKGKKVQISVPLAFTGEAPAEKAGHIIVKALHEIEIEVAPADLPHTLSVDLTKLVEVGDHILASDIQLPHSAALKTAGDDIIASVTAAVEEKEPAPAAEVAAEAAPGSGASEEAPSKE